MQLSVPRYQAIATERGANLDTLDAPLNNRNWLVQRFSELRQKSEEGERLEGLSRMVNWTSPGPGGFYDDLGDVTRQPHLVRGKGFAVDPAFLESALMGFSTRTDSRNSWWTYAESLGDAPLEMHYADLDPGAEYRLRVVYAGDSPRVKIRLEANDGIEIHSLIDKPAPIAPMEFDIPKAATAGGELTLRWRRESGLGGNGRGCQVAEVWLIKK
jgi:hypothetical protein